MYMHMYIHVHAYRYLLSGSSCGRAFIWHVDYPDQPPIVLNGHSKEVTAVCWGHSLTEVCVFLKPDQ